MMVEINTSLSAYKLHRLAIVLHSTIEIFNHSHGNLDKLLDKTFQLATHTNDNWFLKLDC